MKRIATFFILVLLLYFPSPGQATIYFHYDTENVTVGNDLPTTNPGYNFCSLGCSGGDCPTAICRSTVTAPQGTKYWEWGPGPFGYSCYTEIQYATNFPISLTSGAWLYQAYYKRFQRIGGYDVWPAYPRADKGLELDGNNFRWAVSRGRGYGGIGDAGAGHWTVWISNPYASGGGGHFNPEIEVSDTIPLNLVGYTKDNPIILDYDRWYSVVLGVKIANESEHNGTIVVWINGVQVALYENKVTVGSSPTFTYFECGGTIAQDSGDSPAHYRQFDDLMLTDTWQDIVDGGYLRDPEGEAPPPAVPSLRGIKITGGVIK